MFFIFFKFILKLIDQNNLKILKNKFKIKSFKNFNKKYIKILSQTSHKS